MNESNRCILLQERCLFLKHYDLDLSSKCTQLREYCYNKVRIGVAEAIVYDFLKGASSSINDCLEKLKKECSLFSQRSPELFYLCVNTEDVCNKFVSIYKKSCEDFQLQFLSKQMEITNGNCMHWLKKCTRAILDCPQLYHKCRSFRTNCAEKGIFYDILIDLDIDLFEKPLTDKYKNTVQYGYEKLSELGIYVTEVLTLSDIVLADILIQRTNVGTDYCEETLNKKCSLVSHLTLYKSLCNKKLNNNKYDVCKNIYNKNKQYYEVYFKYFLNFSFLSASKHSFSKEECAKYLPLCHLVNKYIDYFIGPNVCKTVRLSCYQVDLESASEMVLMKTLNGMFQLIEEYNGTLWRGPSESYCRVYLFVICKKIMYHNYYILFKCLHPEETCKRLVTYLDIRCKELENNLKKINGNITYSCEKQRKECNELKSCFKSTIKLCKQFETHCNNMDTLMHLKSTIILKNEKHIFQNNQTCLNHLSTYCLQNKNSTNYACANKTNACKYMLNSVLKDCEQLSQHLIAHKNNLGQVSYINHKRCYYFSYHCNMLTLICSNSLHDLCSKVLETCANMLKRNKELNALAKILGEEISDIDKCEKKIKGKCRNSTIDQEKELLCNNYSIKCKHLIPYLEKICDELILKLSRSYFTNSIYIMECQKVESLCSSIKSCTGINNKVSSMCDKYIIKCKPQSPSLPPKPPKPPKPGSEPEKPSVPPKSESEPEKPSVPPKSESEPEKPSVPPKSESESEKLSVPPKPELEPEKPLIPPASLSKSNLPLTNSSVMTLGTNSSSTSLLTTSLSIADLSTTNLSITSLSITTSTTSLTLSTDLSNFPSSSANSSTSLTASSSTSSTSLSNTSSLINSTSSLVTSLPITYSSKHKPTSSSDQRVLGYGIKARGLQKIISIWKITGIILGLQIII
ncbi:hypothetical protein PMAC_000885 [Pneumocystis sp. 'macacae']|nr:hypothetical protein PMAC_000885 [Pneumocystis sp. 'macacae']